MRESWTATVLGEVCKIQSGSGFPTKFQGHEDEQYPFYKVSDMNLPGNEDFMQNANNYVSEDIRRELGAKVLPKGSVIFPKVGGAISTNKKRRVSKNCCVDNNIMGLIPIEEKISPGFLRYFMISLDIFEFSNKANPPSIRQSTVQSWPIALPSLPEQKRIVAILDEAFEGIGRAAANAEKNLANARELFDSYLNAVFTEKGEGWTEKTVGEIADHCLGKMLDKRKNKGSPKPYLRNLNVRWFEFDLSDVLEMRFEEGETERYTVKKGDVLVCEGGYPGRAAIWQKGDPIFFQKALHRVRFNEPMHNRWFLYFIYMADATNKLREHFTGAGIQHFTGQALNRFRLPIPPTSEVEDRIERIEDLFKGTRRLEAIYKRKLDELTELKQSILQKAFSGELTAQPDQALKEAVA